MHIAHSFMAYLWDFDSILYRVCQQENENWDFFDNLNKTSYLHLRLTNRKKYIPHSYTSSEEKQFMPSAYFLMISHLLKTQ